MYTRLFVRSGFGQDLLEEYMKSAQILRGLNLRRQKHNEHLTSLFIFELKIIVIPAHAIPPTSILRLEST